MITVDKIRDEKLHYDINGEAAKTSALLSEKFGRYEYLTGEEIIALDQRKVIEEVKFTFYPLENVLEKQRKTIEDQ